MKTVFYILAFSFVFVSSAVEFNTSDSDFQVSNSENEVLLPSTFRNMSETNMSSVLDVYHKISDGIVSFENETDIFSDGWLKGMDPVFINSSILEDVDADGCDTLLRKELEKHCDDEYEILNGDAQEMEDVMGQAEALCCAVEIFEKCNLRALDKANCGKYKEAIRENMKAARLFITVLANVSCSKFRGLCASSSSAAAVSTFIPGFVGAVTSLAILL